MKEIVNPGRLSDCRPKLEMSKPPFNDQIWQQSSVEHKVFIVRGESTRRGEMTRFYHSPPGFKWCKSWIIDNLGRADRKCVNQNKIQPELVFPSLVVFSGDYGDMKWEKQAVSEMSVVQYTYTQVLRERLADLSLWRNIHYFPFCTPENIICLPLTLLSFPLFFETLRFKE